MPWAFLAALIAIAAVNASAVIRGTDFDGTKGFISTAADQRSLVAIAANATTIAGLFGGIVVAREYGIVIPTFLSSPRRHRAVLAQYGAIAVGGAAIGLVGAALTVAAVAAALPTTEFGFMISIAGVAAGAVLGAGIGAVVRNTGGMVTGADVAGTSCACRRMQTR